MEKFKISFLEKSDISEASRVLSDAMLKVPLHIAVFQGHGEKERKTNEKMFFELLTDLPGITFLAKINRQIVGVTRMKSCDGGQVGFFVQRRCSGASGRSHPCIRIGKTHSVKLYDGVSDRI